MNESETATVDVALVGGTVFDGLGNAPRVDAVVGIVGDRLRVLPAGSPIRAERTIDVSGKFVCPGFIDVHSHSDFASLVFPLAQSKVLAGVTTEINGNCGMSPFPMGGALLEKRQAEYAKSGLTIDWTGPYDYIRTADRVGSSINRGLQVGHGNLRAMTVGWENRPANAGERREMRRLLEEGMDAGCLGLSSGLYYAPGMFADSQELIELCRPVAERGGFYSSHIRSEDDGLLEAVDEFFQVVRGAKVRGQYSHVKTALARNWHKIDPLRERLFCERADGVDFAADRYPYTALCTGLDSVLLPGWVNEGGLDEMLRRLSDADQRKRLADDIRTKHPDATLLDKVIITSVHTDAGAGAVGKSLREWANLRGAQPLEAAFDLLVEQRCRVECIFFAMSEANLDAILSWPFMMIGSDHSVRAAIGPVKGARPHPRAYGTPARFLTDFVRDRKLMTWEEGIRKMTSACATAAGVPNRGVLRDGAYADVTVFDPEVLADRATYDEPRMPPAGIEWVFVNGVETVTAGVHRECRAGRILRAESA